MSTSRAPAESAAPDPASVAEMAQPQATAGEEAYAREGRIPLRIRIGVTGHRDPADPDKLADPIREALKKIRDQFPSTTTTPVRFVILSSLAEGADRLVVREAFDLLVDPGVTLHAVLPMEPAEYITTFETGSPDEFGALLARAAARTITPHTDNHDEAYEQSGQWLVDHSDVLIALWDGREPSGQGGTAEVVAYARDNHVPTLVVQTSRKRHPDLRAVKPIWACQPLDDHSSASETLHQLEKLNRGALRDGTLGDEADRQHGRLSEVAEGSAIHWQFEVAAAWALPRFVRADMLANKYHRRYKFLGDGLYLLSALAVIVVAAQSQAGWSPLLALLEVAFMLTVLLIYLIVSRVGIHKQWMGYRSLAEAFRSALFILMIGPTKSEHSGAADELPTTQEPWFQRAFSEAWRDRPVITPARSSAGELRRFLIEAWMDDQIGYHERASRRLQRERLRLTTAVLVLFGLAVLVAVLHAFEVLPDSWTHLLVFLAIALPASGAALTGVRDQRQYRIHEERSKRMAARLERLKRDLETQTSLQSVQSLAAKIQNVIEAENVDWSGVIELQDFEVVI